jgi:3-hydroxybutyrate dehydrogenase
MSSDVTQTMTGKTVLVTGSTSGIGMAIAEEMLARGANVMFHGWFKRGDGSINQPALDAFTAQFSELQARYPRQKLGFHESDIGDYAATDALVHEATKLGGGKIDVLVNNAGIQIQKSIETLSAQEFDAVIRTNMYGPFYATKAALPFLKRDPSQGFAQIINISSVHGLVPSPERVAYCMAKHGDEALKGVAAAEFAPFNIRVNNINPAFVETDLAMAPIRARAAAHVQNNGMSEADAMQEALSWRLKNQGDAWIPLAAVAKAAADLADFSDTRKSGESIALDNGYIDRAKAAGAAFFSHADKAALDSLNQRVAGQGRGR